MYDPSHEYTDAFKEYLRHAQMTGFDYYLTAQDVGTTEALRIVEKRIRNFESED